MKKIVDIKQIREYVNHELSEQEQRVFEEQMLKDTDLLEEVNATIALKTKLQKKQKQLWHEYEQDYSKNPKKWEQNFEESKVISIPKTGKQRSLYARFARIAAIFLLFLIPLIAYFTGNFSTETTTSLAKTYWEESIHPNQFNFHNQIRKSPQPNLSQEERRKLQLEKAYDFFGEKEYQEVLHLLKEIPKKSNYYAKALLLKGVTYFQIKENQQAILNLQTILQDRSLSGNDDARKFLSLIYLQTNQTEEAKKILEEIIKAKELFAGEAKKLLRQLE
ncbi:MAG: tetratricopeptide repeat protein [Chitinophagales bacterium]